MNHSFVSPSSTSIPSGNTTTGSTSAGTAFFEVWYALFFIVLSLNYIGNILVMLVIVTDKKFHSAMNGLFVNMAFSDFLSGVFSLFWYLVNKVTPEWRSEFVCRVVAANSFTVLSGFVSIFTLTAITLERYNAVVKPLEARMSWLRFKLVLLLIWAMAVLFSSPYFIFIDYIGSDDNTGLCMYVLVPGWRRQLLTTSVFVFTYICPNAVICVVYLKIVKHLWFTKENISMKGSRQALLRSRKKITKLLGSILIVFNFCMFPNFVVDFMLSFGVIGYGHTFAHIVFLVQLVSTCVNPFIFFIQSNQFRHRLMNLLCCKTRKLNRWSTFRGTGMSLNYNRSLSNSQARRASHV